MDDTVQTSAGMIRRDELEVEEIVTEDANNRTIVTEWRNKTALEVQGEDGKLVVVPPGEIVKRDCHVIVKRGQPIGATQASIG